MTKDELIADIKSKIKSIEQIMDEGDFGCVDQDNWERWAKRLAWHEDILEVLCPQPDSATGLMPCGCGSAPSVIEDNMSAGRKAWAIGCRNCTILTGWFNTIDIARTKWNKSRGYPDA